MSQNFFAIILFGLIRFKAGFFELLSHPADQALVVNGVDFTASAKAKRLRIRRSGFRIGQIHVLAQAFG